MIKPIELESGDCNDVWNTLTAAGAGDARLRKRRPMNAVPLGSLAWLFVSAHRGYCGSGDKPSNVPEQ